MGGEAIKLDFVFMSYKTLAIPQEEEGLGPPGRASALARNRRAPRPRTGVLHMNRRASSDPDFFVARVVLPDTDTRHRTKVRLRILIFILHSRPCL